MQGRRDARQRYHGHMRRVPEDAKHRVHLRAAGPGLRQPHRPECLRPALTGLALIRLDQNFAALGTVRFGTPRTEFYSNVSTSNGGAARPLGTTRAGQAADNT